MNAAAAESAAAPVTEVGGPLARFEGCPAGPGIEAPDEVNQAMIRHWVEAMGDENPAYVDEQAARDAGFAGVVAPPTMLQAWTMRGYRKTMEIEQARAQAGPGHPAAAGDDALEQLFGLLDEAGFTSVVATDCDQEYRRPLVLGDRLRADSVIETISSEKHTALGAGHFITTRTDYRDQTGDIVATMRFRILRFRPRQPAPDPLPTGEERPAKARRPRPAITPDTAFFFEGTRQGKLLVQGCSRCGRLRHPPLPSCAHCRSLEWEAVACSGRGTLYSYVVVHHPQVPAFDYPLVIGLVELEEGVRLVADLVHVAPDAVRVGMALEVELVAVDDELTLPMFRPAVSAAAAAVGAAAGASGS